MRKNLSIISFSILLCLIAGSAGAEIRPGVRLGAYFDAESAFVGGEILAKLTDSWYFNPNLEFVFVDNGDLVTFNFDIHYDLTDRGPFYFWIGGGPAIIYFNPDSALRGSDTDLGINLLMGVGFQITDTRLIPYVQPKVILSDNSEFSLAFGIRF